MTPTAETPNVPSSRKGASPENRPTPPSAVLTPAEELLLQQLQQAKFWAEKCAAGLSAAPGQALPTEWRAMPSPIPGPSPAESTSTTGKNSAWGSGSEAAIAASLRSLPERGRPSWPSRSPKGSRGPNGQVCVWQSSSRQSCSSTSGGRSSRHSNLPAGAIGLMGGGCDDEFSEATRVLICVLNSAAKKLPDPWRGRGRRGSTAGGRRVPPRGAARSGRYSRRGGCTPSGCRRRRSARTTPRPARRTTSRLQRGTNRRPSRRPYSARNSGRSCSR